MFRREHHRRIAALLAAFDAELLDDCHCLFGGGTAIALWLDEYRRSDDIDFLCSSETGYRRIREIVFAQGLRGLCRRPLPVLREVRSDQYGVRAVLGDETQPVKFEIVREARIHLAPAPHRLAGVAALDRVDAFAEKLLANTDRGLDRSTLHRDAIDLAAMVHAWGPIPGAAWRKARRAYGEAVDQALAKVATALLAPGELAGCLARLDANDDTADRVRPILAAWAAGDPRPR